MVVLPDPPLGFRTTMRCIMALCITRASEAYAQPSCHRKVRAFAAMSVRSSTPHPQMSPYSSADMEHLLYLWDEIDDWTGACRHLAAAAAAELAVLAAPLLSAGSAVAVWFILPQAHLNAALL